MQLDFFTKLTSWILPDRPAKSKTEGHATPHEDAGLTARARELLRTAGCEAIADRVIVRWNPRMRSTAGLANFEKSLVTLNPLLSDFGDDEIDKTLLHELAHLVARFRAGRRRIAPHGREWKIACRDLGIGNEKRCHTLPLPTRRLKRKHRYRCPECKRELNRVRPFRAKVACLACCRIHGNGRFDERFRLVKLRAPE